MTDPTQVPIPITMPEASDGFPTPPREPEQFVPYFAVENTTPYSTEYLQFLIAGANNQRYYHEALGSPHQRYARAWVQLCAKLHVVVEVVEKVRPKMYMHKRGDHNVTLFVPKLTGREWEAYTNPRRFSRAGDQKDTPLTAMQFLTTAASVWDDEMWGNLTSREVAGGVLRGFGHVNVNVLSSYKKNVPMAPLESPYPSFVPVQGWWSLPGSTPTTTEESVDARSPEVDP